MKAKTRKILFSLSGAVAALFLAPAAHAQTETVWDGAGAWTSATSWSDGIPNNDKIAIVTKTEAGSQTLTTQLNATFHSIQLTNGISDNLALVFSKGVSGGSISITSSNSGHATLRLQTGADASITGSLSFFSAGSTSSAVYSVNSESVLTVSEGITFGANGSGANTAQLTHAGGFTANTTATVNANLTFNNGSRYFASNASATNGTFFINGNVTLQAGSTTGSTPSFTVGYGSDGDAGFTVKVREHLKATDNSLVKVYKGKTLEVGSALFSAGGTLNLGSSTSGVALFKSAGDVTFDGGTLDNSATGGANGGYQIDVGGNFILKNGSRVLLANTANSLTTMNLAGNFMVQANSLLQGNLNALRLTLNGSTLQTLEAAVTNTDQTFAVHTLTLQDAFVALVNQFANIDEVEYFKTEYLVNAGTTTLDLNGLSFYVGDVELLAGTYTEFGGTLHVIPEPASALLGAGLLLSTLWGRRRRN